MSDLLRSVSGDQQFVLANGRTLKNLHELLNALSSMSAHVYSHHVNEGKNDFASWVHHVFHQEKLGYDLAQTTSREEFTRVLKKNLIHVNPSQKKTIVKPNIVKLAKPKKKVEKQEPPPPQPEPKVESSHSHHHQIEQQLNEILHREKEIEYKEKKILTLEEEIEQKLARGKEEKFFSREFVQGMVTGFLLTLIVVLIYVKFVYGAIL